MKIFHKCYGKLINNQQWYRDRLDRANFKKGNSYKF